VPIFGWNLYFSESLFVKRVWEKDRDTLSKDLNCVLNFPKGYHYLLGIVCEGTRFTPQKHEESMKIAREKGLPELKHHLLPRTKGFLLVASQMAHRVDYFYDVNFAMQKVDNHRSPNIFDLMKGRELNAQAYVRRIPIASLPINDDKKCAEYLFKLYKEKVGGSFYTLIWGRG
jgi:lysophosphatidic acid acyltransferase/lysophosphatidylinositol acyltransferase